MVTVPTSDDVRQTVTVEQTPGGPAVQREGRQGQAPETVGLGSAAFCFWDGTEDKECRGLNHRDYGVLFVVFSLLF